MKKKIVHILALAMIWFCSFQLKAQQDPMYSMYMFDKVLVNPAFCGSSPWAVTTIKAREQFLGLNGKPSTQTINFHSPIQAKHIGVGVKIIKDKIAIINNLHFAGVFAYHLNFAGGKLSLGVEAGIINKKINFNDLTVSTLGDNALLSEGIQNAIVPDLSFGTYYQKKQFYFGISNYHALKSKFNYGTIGGSSILKNQLNVIVGNVFDINKSFSYEPSILVKSQPSSATQIDINNMFYYKDKFGLGLQYRTKDALIIIARYNVNEAFRIAYSYDITISKFSPYSKGAHEIVLSYGIKLPPPPTNKETHPRYYF